MTEHDNEVLVQLTRIETLLTQFVGVNGNNGRFGALETLVDKHEAYINEQKGGGKLIHYLWTFIVAAMSGLFAGWLWKK